uniref:Uncharacterized protein n=1 Tax=Brassica oleracea TaxID=3712 RepID=A0A3P6DUQ6_BRAOL|nr:unnamed protein product [Brassica oleracea]
MPSRALMTRAKSRGRSRASPSHHHHHQREPSHRIPPEPCPWYHRLVTCRHVCCVVVTYRIREMESISREGERAFEAEAPCSSPPPVVDLYRRESIVTIDGAHIVKVQDPLTLPQVVIAKGLHTFGLAMLLVRVCGAETFVPWTLLERAGVQRQTVLATLRILFVHVRAKLP